MITSRGWWLLIITLAVLALGVLAGRFALTLVGLSVLLWFIAEWARFAWRVRVVAPGLYLRRELWDERGAVDTLWAGRTFRVRAVLRLRGWFSLPYLRVTDRLPFGAELAAGAPHAEG